MEEFCPLCMKRGLKKRMKAIQINLQEAVWMCESEECIWPMDYKELEFIPRKIGESWSCYWNNYKPSRPAVMESHYQWQPFVTPPYTPKTEVSPAASSDTSSHSSNGVNRSHSIYSKESVSLHSSKEAVTSNSTNEQSMETVENNRISENSINTSLPTHKDEEVLLDIINPPDSNQFFLDKLQSRCLKSKNLDTESTVSAPKNLDSNVTPSFKTLHTKVPTIVSIEKTNLVKVRGINSNKKLLQKEPILKSTTEEVCENRISNMPLIKESSKEKLIDNSSPQNSALEIKAENLLSNNSNKTEDAVINLSSVEVRTVKIHGLPPVTLMYEVPSFLQETKNIIVTECKEEVKLEPVLEVSKKIEVEKCIQPLSKKCIMASKMYEKFNFSELRKAKNLQKNGINKAPISNSNEKKLEIKESVIDMNETNLISETKMSEPVLEIAKSISTDQNLPSDNTKSVINISENTITPEITNPVNTDRNLSPDSDDSKDNVISDLDSFLNEFIEENNVNINESMSSNIIVDDDWLTSLLG